MCREDVPECHSCLYLSWQVTTPVFWRVGLCAVTFSHRVSSCRCFLWFCLGLISGQRLVGFMKIVLHSPVVEESFPSWQLFFCAKTLSHVMLRPSHILGVLIRLQDTFVWVYGLILRISVCGILCVINCMCNVFMLNSWRFKVLRDDCSIN